MIQKLKYSLYCLLCLSVFIACKDDKTEPVSFGIELEEIAAENTGVIQSFEVIASGKWNASTEEPWISLTPGSGEGTTLCELVVDTSVLITSRSGSMRFASETGESKTLSVTQLGFKRELILPTNDTSIVNYGTNGERYTEIRVVTNVALTHTIVDMEDGTSTPAWIECANADEFNVEETGAMPQIFYLRFDWEDNYLEEPRVAKVTFTSEDLEAPVELIFRQEAGLGITDDAAGDSTVLVIVERKMNPWTKWDKSNAINSWNGVTIWKRTDQEVKDNLDMLGRVRSLTMEMTFHKGAPPVELGHLKYLESLTLRSNTGGTTNLSEHPDGIGNLKYLKSLVFFSYGLNGELPESWLGLDNLQTLGFQVEEFTSIPELLTPENFPKLTALDLTANKKGSNISLFPIPSRPLDKIGLYQNASAENLMRLFRWEKLEYLGLSNCVLYGNLPTAEQIFESVGGVNNHLYTAADVAAQSDTLDNLIGTPKVLPNARTLRLNLNFMNGTIPDWILYHPRLRSMDPFILIYNQESKPNADGVMAGFDNVPDGWSYYYDFYPRFEPHN